mgnify:CR=1 FL=1
MQAHELLRPTPAGLYCPPGDFYIDPVKPVPRALITHGHSDHARAGHGAVLATPQTLAIMSLRMGDEFTGSRQPAAYGEELTINEVAVRFAPAGHVLGSAQIRVSYRGQRITVSGDYKREADPTCAPFEVLPCDIFISEATFGLPVFRHPPAGEEIAKLLHSLALFSDECHLVGAYGLGKAQRLLALLRQAGYHETIYLHGALVKLCAFYQAEGIALGPLAAVSETERGDFAGKLVLCPPGSLNDAWSRRFAQHKTCFASGWMRIRARARQRGVELPLIISDHADWDDLTRTILETGCHTLWVTHGQEDALVHWARQQGLNAAPLRLVGYGDEDDDDHARSGGET